MYVCLLCRIHAAITEKIARRAAQMYYVRYVSAILCQCMLIYSRPLVFRPTGSEANAISQFYTNVPARLPTLANIMERYNGERRCYRENQCDIKYVVQNEACSPL